MRQGLEVWNSIKKRFRHQVTFTELGRVSEKEISLVLQKCDFGVTTTDLDIIGKSGTTIAMLEHGLPVFLTETKSSNNVIINEKYIKYLIHPQEICKVLNEPQRYENQQKREINSISTIDERYYKFYFSL
jgi:glycosyltransferase involved in cell wall biosynthesis